MDKQNPSTKSNGWLKLPYIEIKAAIHQYYPWIAACLTQLLLIMSNPSSKPNLNSSASKITKSKKKITDPEKQRAKRWVYTLNNPTNPILYNDLTMDYLIYGEEKGESGTYHHQGFVIFKNLKTLKNCKEIHNKCHWEVAAGNNQQASDYCKKDGVFHEFGILPEDPHKRGGKATQDKWRFIVDSAKAGNLDAISDSHPKQFVGSYRTLKQIRVDYTPEFADLPDVCGVWYYGLSNAGKSTRARKDFPSYYSKAVNKWFDGYQDQDAVIIDDLDKTHSYMSYYLKIWSDKFKFYADTKGGALYVRPKHLVITSQYKIEDIWDDIETITALQRRFKVVIVKREDWDNPISQWLNTLAVPKDSLISNETLSPPSAISPTEIIIGNAKEGLTKLSINPQVDKEKSKMDWEEAIASSEVAPPKDMDNPYEGMKNALKPPNVFKPDRTLFDCVGWKRKREPPLPTLEEAVAESKQDVVVVPMEDSGPDLKRVALYAAMADRPGNGVSGDYIVEDYDETNWMQNPTITMAELATEEPPGESEVKFKQETVPGYQVPLERARWLKQFKYTQSLIKTGIGKRFFSGELEKDKKYTMQLRKELQECYENLHKLV